MHYLPKKLIKGDRLYFFILKYRFLLGFIFFCNNIIFGINGFGVNSGFTYFDVKTSSDSKIFKNEELVGYLTNHGFENGLNHGFYLFYNYNNYEFEAEINTLTKRYSFSFKNQLQNPNAQTKIYNTNFALDNLLLNVIRPITNLNFKKVINTDFLLGFGLGMGRATPIVFNSFLNQSENFFIFDVNGDPDLSNGTLSLRTLNRRLNILKAENIAYSINGQIGFRFRMFNIETSSFFRYTFTGKTANKRDLVHKLKGFGTLLIRLGIYF